MTQAFFSKVAIMYWVMQSAHTSPLLKIAFCLMTRSIFSGNIKAELTRGVVRVLITVELWMSYVLFICCQSTIIEKLTNEIWSSSFSARYSVCLTLVFVLVASIFRKLPTGRHLQRLQGGRHYSEVFFSELSMVDLTYAGKNYFEIQILVLIIIKPF